MVNHVQLASNLSVRLLTSSSPLSSLWETTSVWVSALSAAHRRPKLDGSRQLSTTTHLTAEQRSYRLLVVGGGTAGSAMANKFASKLGRGKVAVLEPSEVHYYQPMFTLVGSGLKQFEQTCSTTASVLPKDCDWIKQSAVKFDPDNSTVTTDSGQILKYGYLIVALGLQLNYHLIKGCVEAMEADQMVCSNYSPKYVHKTWTALQAFKSGNAVFTFPNTPVKCAGAPQKICYLAEDYLSRNGKRKDATVIYNTSLGVIFGIPRYAAVLEQLVKERNIQVNKKRNLIEVRHQKKEAVFEVLESGGKTETYQYSMLHVSPPMSTPKVLWDSGLVDKTNFVDVNRDTLQHVKYRNVFAMGDCNNAPTSKTAAAIASQVGVVGENLKLVMAGKEPRRKYDGYTSCPLTVTHNKCILAEFGYDGAILETFPIDQSKARHSMFYMKATVMPIMYWRMLVKGLWHGPGVFRKLFRLGMTK